MKPAYSQLLEISKDFAKKFAKTNYYGLLRFCSSFKCLQIYFPNLNKNEKSIKNKDKLKLMEEKELVTAQVVMLT